MTHNKDSNYSGQKLNIVISTVTNPAQGHWYCGRGGLEGTMQPCGENNHIKPTTETLLSDSSEIQIISGLDLSPRLAVKADIYQLECLLLHL